MYKDINEEFPNMKPLKEEVYNKLIFLSGINNLTMLDSLIEAEVGSIAVSFYHIKDWPIDKTKTKLNKFDNVILFAGENSFLEKEKNKEKPSDTEIKFYINQYMDFCSENSNLFNFVFECTLGNLISPEYRNAHLQELEARGVRVVPIVRSWMFEYPQQYGLFERLMVALPPEITGGDSGPVEKALNTFKRKGVLVHAIGATDQASINNMAYFSVDSGTWASGGKYGVLSIFENHLKQYSSDQYMEAIENHKQNLISNGLDISKLLEKNTAEINKANAVAWKNYSESIKYNINNSFWLSELDKAQAKDKIIEQKSLSMVPDSEEKFLVEHRNASKLRNTPLKEFVPENIRGFFDPRLAFPINCNDCSHSSNCPAYREDATCYFNSTFQVSDANDLANMLGALNSMQYSRISHLALIEKLQGGNPHYKMGEEMKTQMFLADTMLKALEVAKKERPKEDALGKLFQVDKEENDDEEKSKSSGKENPEDKFFE